MKYDFSDKKTTNKVIIAVILIPTILFSYFWFENNEIDTHKTEVYARVIKRDVDYKGLVTITAEYYADGKTYNVSELITSYEKEYNITVDIGDTVIVEYSNRAPIYSRLVLLNGRYK